MLSWKHRCVHLTNKKHTFLRWNILVFGLYLVFNRRENIFSLSILQTIYKKAIFYQDWESRHKYALVQDICSRWKLLYWMQTWKIMNSTNVSIIRARWNKYIEIRIWKIPTMLLKESFMLIKTWPIINLLPFFNSRGRRSFQGVALTDFAYTNLEKL